MDRRTFLAASLASGAFLPALAQTDARRRPVPDYRVVTKYNSAGRRIGMPGPYPGRVVTVHAATCIDEVTETSRRADRAAR